MIFQFLACEILSLIVYYISNHYYSFKIQFGENIALTDRFLLCQRGPDAICKLEFVFPLSIFSMPQRQYIICFHLQCSFGQMTNFVSRLFDILKSIRSDIVI